MSATLLRGIGLVGAGLLVLNSMIGAGIFALPGVVGAEAGTLAPWLFLLVGLLFLSVVFCFAELAGYFSATGGPVLYAGAAFGPLAAFASGWLLYVSRMAAFAANATAMATYLGAIWAPVAAGPGRGLFIAAICIGFTAVNYIGVKDGVRTVALFTLMKLAPLLLLVLVGLGELTPELLWPVELPRLEDPGELVLLLIYAYLGFEAPVAVSGETRDPLRTMPRALVGSVLGVTLLYMLILFAFIAGLPAEQREGATLVDLGRVLLGDWGALVLGIAAVFSIGGNLAVNMLSVPRVSYALAEQGLLPPWLGRVHPRYRTPGNSVLLLGGLCLLFALSGSFVFLAVASALMRMLSYLLCIAALWRIRAQRGVARGWLQGTVVPAVAALMCAWIAAQASLQAWLLVAALLALGGLLYALARRGAAPVEPDWG